MPGAASIGCWMGRWGVVLCAAVTSFALMSPPAWAAFPGGNGRIAVTRTDTGVSPSTTDIWTMLPNGQGSMRLTTSGKGEHPAWSADGSRIAFVDDGRLVTADEDGSQRQVVLNSPGFIYDIAWSPGETKLAITRGAFSGGV